MSAVGDITTINANILTAFEARKVKLFALSLSYAGKAINRFRAQQGGNVYWDNQTNEARKRMFSNAFIEGETVGWFLSHGVQYGVYLELANDRQNEAIKPIIDVFAPQFFRDVKELF